VIHSKKTNEEALMSLINIIAAKVSIEELIDALWKVNRNDLARILEKKTEKKSQHTLSISNPSNIIFVLVSIFILKTPATIVKALSYYRRVKY